MRVERLYARQRSKYRAATTDSRHGGPIAPNHLQGLAVQRLDQVWATDATCVLTGQGWFFWSRGFFRLFKSQEGRIVLICPKVT
jgi:transposase InsO family protein